MKVVRFTGSLVMLFATVAASAAGFGSGYTVRYGDFNGDGRRDLMVVAPRPSFVQIAVDDIAFPIKTCCDEQDKLLLNQGGGRFQLLNALTAAQQLVTALWPEAQDLIVYSRDFDFDGIDDLELIGVKELISDANDMLLFGNGPQAAPTLKIEDLAFRAYHEQVFRWMQNNNYFVEAAPRVIVRQQSSPKNLRWYASVMDRTNTVLIDKFLRECQLRFPDRQCGVSREFPPNEDCYRNVRIYDANGNYLFTQTTNVCDYELHIVMWTSGTVVYAPDYSVFESAAMETAEILRRLNEGCEAMGSADSRRLDEIMSGRLTRPLRDVARPWPSNTPNEMRHEPFPGDELFNPSVTTFHHYDVITDVCRVTESNCTLAVVRDQVHRYFSFPNYRLAPKWTPVDFVTRETAYVSPPFLTGDPGWYTFPAGPITQKWVGAYPWQGAVQNVTGPQHIVHPGTISRYLWQEGGVIKIRTHGMGYNRAFCGPSNSLLDNWGLYVLIGNQNDVHGAKAFKQLDKQMKKYWRSNFRPGGNQKITPTGPVAPEDMNPVLE